MQSVLVVECFFRFAVACVIVLDQIYGGRQAQDPPLGPLCKYGEPARTVSNILEKRFCKYPSTVPDRFPKRAIRQIVGQVSANQWIADVVAWAEWAMISFLNHTPGKIIPCRYVSDHLAYFLTPGVATEISLRHQYYLTAKEIYVCFR